MNEKTKVFFCTLCEKTFPSLPDGSIKLTNNNGRGCVNVWKLPDGSTHAIVKRNQ